MRVPARTRLGPAPLEQRRAQMYKAGPG